ncbi:hypothetical protein ACQKMD_07900 [Viridibacillus sp. NPDC096237]|uniref:hypothetical protein n=1 Tax=Viridibacillus sp. NPDC096237 TaxID=3390721 RepID=UPI003D0847C6
MTVQIQRPTDIPLLAVFLEMMNNRKEHHVGFCSLERHTIHSKLTYYFSDLPLKESFVVAYDNGEIVGALGFDIYLNLNKAKVCGPFVKYLDKYPFLAEDMWLALNEDMPAELETFEFLVNENNFSIRQLLLKLQANEVKRMFFSKAMKDSIENLFYEDTSEIQSDVHPFHKSFCNFLQIEEDQWLNFTSTLNEDQKLFFYIDEVHNISGYAYIRVEPIHYVGEIHHFTFQSLSKEKCTKLLRKSLQHIFSYHPFKQTELFLDIDEQLNVFTDAGFKVTDEMIYYQFIKTT